MCKSGNLIDAIIPKWPIARLLEDCNQKIQLGEDRQFWVILAFSDFHKMISSQGFGIVYHLNGLSGNTNIR